MMIFRFLLISFFSFLTFSCGGVHGDINYSTEVTQEDKLLFDNGIDLIEDPEMLQGSWREEWEDENKGRVIKSDLIAIVEIMSISTFELPGKAEGFTISFKTNNNILKKAPSEWSVKSLSDDLGYASIAEVEEKILNKNYIISVKYYKPEGSERRLSVWHLSPATEHTLDYIRFILSQSNPKNTDKEVRVFESNN